MCLPHETFRELGAAQVMDAVIARLGLPIVVKPARSGSALGCTLVESAADLPDAMVNAFAYGSVALIETFVAGTEVSVPVVDDGSGPRALPAVAIKPDGPIYDYTARYTAGSTEFTVPAGLPADVLAECARVAVAAHEALGLRDLSRSDLIVARRRHGLLPRGQRRARLHRDLRWSRCRSRPPGSTWARSWPRWSAPRRRATPGPATP